MVVGIVSYFLSIGPLVLEISSHNKGRRVLRVSVECGVTIVSAKSF